MVTKSNDYIVIQATTAYESFCATLSRRGDKDFISFDTRMADYEIAAKWIFTYKRTHLSKWWRLMSHEDIVSCLSVLPLNRESMEELTELVKSHHQLLAICCCNYNYCNYCNCG